MVKNSSKYVVQWCVSMSYPKAKARTLDFVDANATTVHYLKWTFPKWGHEWLIIALSTVLGHFLAENLDQLLDTKHTPPIKMIRKRTCASKFISSFEWPVSRRFQSFLCPWWIPLGYVPPLLNTNRFNYFLSEPLNFRMKWVA